jgi:hypothetical protein
MKSFMKFMTGMLFNVVMGVVLASFIGVDAAYGAASGVVLPMALGCFMPGGALMEGIYTEVWTGELVKKLNAGLQATFLNGIPDYSTNVNNEVIHLVDVGGDPEVLVNNTTYPIPIQDLEDGDIAIGLDKFQTKATRVTDDELYAISYDKFGSVVERHRDSIVTVKYKKFAHALAPYSHTAKTPVIQTSGEKDAVSGRNKLTPKDIIALKRAFDNMEVPEDGRVLVLCPDHVNDLLELDQSFKDKYYNYTSGKLMNMYGFEVYTFVNAPYFNKNGVKLAYNAVPTATDHKGSFAFYRPRTFRAQGSTKMYYSEAATNPQTQENLVNFRNYDIVLPKKMEAIGAIYSWDGSTAQSKDQTAAAEKRWPQVRREAAAAAQASTASTTGGETETD